MAGAPAWADAQDAAVKTLLRVVVSTNENVVDSTDADGDGGAEDGIAAATTAVLTGLGGLGKTITCCKLIARVLLGDGGNCKQQNQVGKNQLRLLRDKNVNLRGVLPDTLLTHDAFKSTERQHGSGSQQQQQQQQRQHKVLAPFTAVAKASMLIAAALIRGAPELGLSQPVENDNDIKVQEHFERCRADWQRTKRAWLTLRPGGTSVPYPTSSIYAYALGTSLMHALLARQLLISHLAQQQRKVERVVVLCGGSGAEVVGLRLALESLGDTYAGREVHVDVVDVNPDWNLVTKWLLVQDAINNSVKDNSRSKRLHGIDVRFIGEFHCIDLLSDAGQSAAAALGSRADLVLLLYGLTELHDINRTACERCLCAVRDALQEGSRLLIADPLKTCHGKDHWLQDLLCTGDKARDVSFQSLTPFKVTMQEQDVADSALGPLIATVGLRMNEDVKLSVHVWGVSVGPKPDSSGKGNGQGAFGSAPLTLLQPPSSRVAVIVVPRFQCIGYYTRWLSAASGGKLRIFSLGRLSEAQDEQETLSGLWHLESALSSPGGGVALLTAAQLSLVCRAPRLLSLLHGSLLSVVDDADTFLRYSRPARVSAAVDTINAALGSRSPRVTVCTTSSLVTAAMATATSAKRIGTVVKLGEPVALSHDDASFLHSLQTALVHSVGVSLEFCRQAEYEQECPLGLLNPDSAVFVTLDRRPPPGLVLCTRQAHTFVRELQESPRHLGPDVQDAVFLLPKGGKKKSNASNHSVLSLRRENEIVELLAAQLVNPTNAQKVIRIHLHCTPCHKLPKKM